MYLKTCVIAIISMREGFVFHLVINLVKGLALGYRIWKVGVRGKIIHYKPGKH